ncbi:MAG: hypothetical protein HY840_11710 [Bacteroidetes bacterium]|nr:hypothetical protein [Bacteroidota bacterium]
MRNNSFEDKGNEIEFTHTVSDRGRHCEGASPLRSEGFFTERTPLEKTISQIFFEIASPKSGLAMTMCYGIPDKNKKNVKNISPPK